MGPKQPPAKKQKTDEDEARATILKYIITQNRPYNSTDVYNNLHSSIGKTLVGKILDKLAEDKEITAKAFGKTTIYFPNQNADDIPSAEETREIDVKIASLKEEASVLKAENTANEKILNSLKNTEKTYDLEKTLASLNEENEKLETRLQGIRNGTRKLTVEDKKRADAKLEANRKQWRIRKQWFKESWAQISENLPPKKVKEVLEDLCVETDELANVCYETQLTELMN